MSITANIARMGCARYCLLGLVFFTQASVAQVSGTPDDPLTLYVSSTTYYDDNLFRLASNVNTQDAIGENHRSAFTEAATAAVHLNQQYAQQQITGDASYTRLWYQTFDYLNGGITNYNLAWNWHLTSRVEGTVSGRRTETPANYDFFRDTSRRNLTNRQEYRLRMNANPYGGWHLIGGGGYSTTSSDAATSDTPKSEQNFFDGGLGYVSAAGSNIEIVGRHANGKYSRSNTSEFAEARDYEENSFEVQFVGNGQQTVSLNLVGGYLWRDHEQNPGRDYQGWTADSKLTWNATDKLVFTGEAMRTLTPYQADIFTHYSRSEYTFTPAWVFSPKLSVSAPIGYNVYKFGGELASASNVARTDRIGTYSLKANWIPRRYIAVTASLGKRVRDSSFALRNLDYEDATASLSLALSY
ncbi:outer membrane beta-barrel protein [Hydrocarboniphaga sp.]|uniref:outer membrane beta-barrel protein n=1 Tax=Hydrocarboniphaga sp. TaxID=2033016 RepID=UPI003D152697